MSQTLKELRQIASHVALFHDYLEITNPGAPHFGITPEKLTPTPRIEAVESYRCQRLLSCRHHRALGQRSLNIIDW